MIKRKKQKANKREAKTKDIEVYDVLPSVRKRGKRSDKKPLRKLDRSESCL